MANQDKQLKKLQDHLEDGEQVVHAISGSYVTSMLQSDHVRKGIFAATNMRLIFFAKKMTGYDMEVLPFHSISSIEMGKGMLGHSVTFFTSGNKAALKWVKNKTEEVRAFVDYVKQNMGKKGSNTGGDDSMDQLHKLAELKDKGVITEEEFAAKKKQILGL